MALTKTSTNHSSAAKVVVALGVPRLRLLLCLVLFSLISTKNMMVEGKLATCKTRFTKKTQDDYCTKFGVM